MKPTPAQIRALSKLTDEWQPAYCLDENVTTLKCLVARKLADVRCINKSNGFLAAYSYEYRLTAQQSSAIGGEK